MKVLGHLYKILKDHTKDAAMLLDYAEELKNEPEMADIMKFFITTAAGRLTKDYKETKAVIEAIMEKTKEEPDSIASIALEELEDWKNSLIHRIEKF